MVETGLSDEDCWKWIGKKNVGYGIFCCIGFFRANRFSYFIHNGSIPEGKSILHSCDNKECTNPKHLRIGTHEDNMRDAVERNRMARGERVAKAKLNDDKVRSMRIIRKNSNMTYKKIGEMFGVTKCVAHEACKRITWKHVT